MIALLSNDDGIHADGLAALHRALEKFFDEIWVVAPAEEASQIGHRVTTHGPLRYEKRAERQYALHGTPADCTRVALEVILPRKPDWVFSGINHGGNLGRHDFVISGTVAAVREAAFFGHRAMAVSQFFRGELAHSWETAAEWTAGAFEAMKDERLAAGEFWNVNLPHLDPGMSAPELIRCPQEQSPLQVIFRQVEEGVVEYAGDYQGRPREEDSDVAVCFGGNIAVSKVSV